MVVYMDLVMLLNFVVDFLLLAGSNQLAGYSGGYKRIACSAALGAIYAGACMLPHCQGLQNVLCRFLSLVIMSLVAFGFRRSALRRSMLFVLLSFAMGGAATAFGQEDMITFIFIAALIVLMCTAGLNGRLNGRRYLSVQLTYQKRQYSLTALVDTGNTLLDPVSGQQVLVVGQDVASELLGLTPQQLADPIRTILSAPCRGLRLIPYRSVGQAAGFLLAIDMDHVQIGRGEAPRTVAFAPDKFHNAEGYQGLTGGIL